MISLRKYGAPPYRVAVVHGGPGAPGYMAPVARELARERGVLEPLQTERSLEGQLDELARVLDEHADLPATLVGSSWGAMLGVLVAGRYPKLVGKLVLVGSAAFESKSAAQIFATRMGRLDETDRRDAEALFEALADPESHAGNARLQRLVDIFTTADCYDPVTLDLEILECQLGINTLVWGQAARLRTSGELLERASAVRCPVVAIHGDYDPHPVEGVAAPLGSVLEDFRMIVLERCGHYPWIERHARDAFYEVLRTELTTT